MIKHRQKPKWKHWISTEQGDGCIVNLNKAQIRSQKQRQLQLNSWINLLHQHINHLYIWFFLFILLSFRPFSPWRPTNAVLPPSCYHHHLHHHEHDHDHHYHHHGIHPKYLGRSSIYRYILLISVIIIIMLKSSWYCSITLIVLSVGVQPRS